MTDEEVQEKIDEENERLIRDAQEQYTAESGAELKSRCHELTLEKRNRGKYGQPLANDYRLNLSTSCKKGKIKGADSVAQDNTAVLPTPTPLCCPRQHQQKKQQPIHQT